MTIRSPRQCSFCDSGEAIVEKYVEHKATQTGHPYYQYKGTISSAGEGTAPPPTVKRYGMCSSCLSRYYREALVTRAESAKNEFVTCAFFAVLGTVFAVYAYYNGIHSLSRLSPGYQAPGQLARFFGNIIFLVGLLMGATGLIGFPFMLLQYVTTARYRRFSRYQRIPQREKAFKDAFMIAVRNGSGGKITST